MSKKVNEGYTMREIFALAVNIFDLKVSTYEFEYNENFNKLLGKYKKRMAKIFEENGIKNIGQKPVKPNNNPGDAYDYKAVDFILFDEDGLYNQLLKENRKSDEIPVKPNSYYETLRKEEVKTYLKVIEEFESNREYNEDEVTLEDIYYDKELFLKKKLEIMAEAVFKDYYVLDEEKLRHDIMNSLMYDPKDDASVIRSIENLKDNKNYYKKK